MADELDKDAIKKAQSGDTSGDKPLRIPRKELTRPFKAHRKGPHYRIPLPKEKKMKGKNLGEHKKGKEGEINGR